MRQRLSERGAGPAEIERRAGWRRAEVALSRCAEQEQVPDERRGACSAMSQSPFRCFGSFRLVESLANRQWRDPSQDGDLL
jgi:hypothetical protein